MSTSDGLVGWSDIETAPHVAAAAVTAPESGAGMFEGVRELVLGEDPFEVERLWDKVYRGTSYYGRRGVAIQLISGLDIACHDLMGKATGPPAPQATRRRSAPAGAGVCLYALSPDGRRDPARV